MLLGSAELYLMNLSYLFRIFGFQLLSGTATALLLLPGQISLAQTEELWGENGAAWKRDSILPDWSFAGYHQGNRPIPKPTNDLLVTDFGAVGDGETDCTEAFQKAILEGAGNTILIPAGTYLISDRLKLHEPNTALIGEGTDKSILFFTRGLQEIEPTPATTGGGMETTAWSWSGGIITLGKSSGAGGSRKTPIASEASRGESTFDVEDGSDYEPGTECLIQVTDTAERTLLNYLHRGRTGDISRLSSRPMTVTQPVTVKEVTGNQITIDQRLRFDLRSEWNPVVAHYSNQSQEIGIADFTIRFPERPYRGHWMEDGLNGFEIKGVHNWARNIRVQNSDSGAYITGAWSTVDGLVIEAEREAHDSGNTGHHGLTVQGRECLVTNFVIDTKFFHDITVSNNSYGNVISKGKGIDLSLDHHRAAPYENLFTEIDLGEGTRVWNSGGTGGKGLHTASGATFWNMDSKKRFDLPKEDFGPPGIIFAGVNVGSVRTSQLPEGWHFEKVSPDKIEPQNLHLGQLQLRKGSESGTGSDSGSDDSGASKPPPADFSKWINTEGAVIEARFHGLTDTGVKLEMRDGRKFVYPLSKLSEASRKLASELGRK